MTGREIAEIQGDLEEIRDRLLEIYDELDEKYDPKTARHVWGAYCHTEEALGRLWRGVSDGRLWIDNHEAQFFSDLDALTFAESFSSMEAES